MMVLKRRLLGMILLFVMVLLACNLPSRTISPTAEATARPTEILPPTLTSTPPADFSITRQISGVQWGLTDPLDLLDTDLPQPFPDQYRVTTNASGEALLQGQGQMGSCRIYVYLDSILQKKACPKATFQGANASCVEEGSVSFQDCRDLFVSTPSVELKLLGTWALVTYMPDSQATIAMVNEGTVEMAPVVDTSQETLGPRIEIGAGEFVYTAPDDVMRELPGMSARTPQKIERLSGLIQGYDILPWLNQAEQRATQANVAFPDPQILTGGPDLVVQVERQHFDPALQERLAGDNLLYTPVRITIFNRGGEPAEGFKVSADARASDGTFGRPLVVAGQDNGFYAFVDQGLSPGGQAILDGAVGFPREYEGQTVQIVITVDSCAGEEFVQPFCRINEQNENNNTSDPLSVRLELPQ
jgi:hypothetical protein